MPHAECHTAVISTFVVNFGRLNNSAATAAQFQLLILQPIMAHTHKITYVHAGIYHARLVSESKAETDISPCIIVLSFLFWFNFDVVLRWAHSVGNTFKIVNKRFSIPILWLSIRFSHLSPAALVNTLGPCCYGIYWLAITNGFLPFIAFWSFLCVICHYCSIRLSH